MKARIYLHQQWDGIVISWHYQTNFEQFVSTDVIDDVVDNGNKLHDYYESLKNPFLDYGNKSVKLYNCPSEKLNDTHNFISEYKNNFDAVLFDVRALSLKYTKVNNKA